MVFILGYYLHRWLISRVTGIRVVGAEAEGHYARLILTLGLSLVLQNGGLIVFGSMPQSVRTPLASSAWEIGPFFGGSGSVFLNQARSYGSAVAAVVVVGLYLFMSRTSLGKTLRAAADNPEAATYMGIDVDRAHRIAFALGVGITAVAGGLVGTYYPFQPYVGLDFVIIMYAGVVLGGVGSVPGAFAGGMTIGFVQRSPRRGGRSGRSLGARMASRIVPHDRSRQSLDLERAIRGFGGRQPRPRASGRRVFEGADDPR